MKLIVADTLLISRLLARKYRDVVLHCPDHKPSNCEEDKQDDDNNGNGDISFHRDRIYVYICIYMS